MDGVEYYGADRLPEGRIALRRPHHHGVSPTYALRDPGRRTSAWASMACCASARVGLSGILNGIDDGGLGPGHRPAHRRALFDAQRWHAQAPPTRRRCSERVRAAVGRRRAAVRRGQPADAAEGPRPAARGAARRCSSAAARSWRCSAPASAELEAAFARRRRSHPGQLGVAHRLRRERSPTASQAGADALLVPSRFEPCGLTQLYALRYGTVPVVARVGGLADTVIDANEMAIAAGVATGVQFAPVTADRLAAALVRAHALYCDRPVWKTLQRNGMRADVSWRRPAEHYAQLYRALLNARNPHVAM
ncbi:MAG: glycosyltransferase [Rhodopseudomonas palustris]|nr:glycosyltransferase [Rhodopseudomonas palustris]